MNSWFDYELILINVPKNAPFQGSYQKNKALMILDHARFPHHQKHHKNTKDSVEVPFGMASTWCSELHKASTSSWTFFGGPAIFLIFSWFRGPKVGGVYVLVDFFSGAQKKSQWGPPPFSLWCFETFGGVKKVVFEVARIVIQPSRRDEAAGPLASGRVLRVQYLKNRWRSPYILVYKDPYLPFGICAIYFDLKVLLSRLYNLNLGTYTLLSCFQGLQSSSTKYHGHPSILKKN